MNEIKVLFKLIVYGWKLEYHLNKINKLNFDEHPTVLNYNYEMSKYYYEKIYGKSFN